MTEKEFAKWIEALDLSIRLWFRLSITGEDEKLPALEAMGYSEQHGNLPRSQCFLCDVVGESNPCAGHCVLHIYANGCSKAGYFTWRFAAKDIVARKEAALAFLKVLHLVKSRLILEHMPNGWRENS